MPSPPVSSGGVGGKGSPFANAAKVLFDSAQRMGAVKPLGSNNRMYAHQLKRIQNQSKKRGGSLGGVSYKVSEFLATQRPSASSMGPEPRPNTRSVAKRVPLLNIRLPSAKPARTEPPVRALADKKDASTAHMPSLEIPSLVPRQPVQLPPQPAAETLAAHPAEASSLTAEPKVPEAERPAVSMPDVLITEDRPMFEVRPTQAPSAPVAAVKSAAPQAVMPSTATPAAAADAAKKPSLVVPSIVEAAGQVREAKTEVSSAAPSFSVDSWEQQREKEIERLQQKKQEEENWRLAALLEEEHRALGNKWVEARTKTTSTVTPTTPEEKLNYSIAAATTVDGALSLFEKLVALGGRSSGVASTAAWSVAQRLIKAPLMTRFANMDRFVSLLEKSSVPADVKSRIKLRFANGEDLVSQYHSMDETARKSLGRPQVKKLVGTLAFRGFWEEAIQLATVTRTYLDDRAGLVELSLTRAARSLEAEPKAAIAAFVTKSLNATGRMGMEAKLALALLESGPMKMNTIAQLAASPEADERVYGELLKRTAPERVDTLLGELEKRGLNRNDPNILWALVSVKLRSENTLDVFAEIERQAAIIGYRNFHVGTAVTAVMLTPSKEVLAAAVKLIGKRPAGRTMRSLQVMLPFLYANEMFAEIVELVDLCSVHLPIARALPEHVAFANEALIKAGREPLTSLTVRECGIAVPEAGVSGGLSHTSAARGAANNIGQVEAGTASGTVASSVLGRSSDGTAALSPAAVSGDLTSTTETMLSYAKEKQWAKALGVLDTLKEVPAQDLSGNSTAAALTLVYNCALSAAVEKPDVVLSVFALMKERKVAANATTVNTVLSSLSKSAQWEESVPFFESTTNQQRDMNTYLVMVSLLGKHSKWEEAVKVYDEMKRTNPKPPATMFTVAIGATINHSWAETLRIFQEMLKVHGASVKDSVANQVVRCLEQNGKNAEVTKLEKEIQKKKKKKK